MKADIKKIEIAFSDLRTAILMIQVDKKLLKALPDKNKPMTIEIKKKAKKRSLNANAFMWELCEQIALKTGLFKDDVYRTAVQAVGVFSTVRVIKSAASDLEKNWESKGIGWVAVPINESNGWVDMQLYAGTSTYTTEQMARVIDWLTDEATNLGIRIEAR